MLSLRRAEERGRVDYGWLDTRHTFSFGDYYDARYLGFRSLRVINDDRVAGGAGFPAHPHRDMEIVTYVLEGAVRHRDSTGGGSVIERDDVQRMSAGSGVLHSERNASASEPLRLLQIWILPASRGIAPGYEQKRFSREEKRAGLRLIASPDGREGSLTIHQDVAIHAAILSPGDLRRHDLSRGRHAWLQVARGRVRVNDQELGEGDGLAVSDEPALEIVAVAEAEIVLFDLA